MAGASMEAWLWLLSVAHAHAFVIGMHSAFFTRQSREQGLLPLN